MRAILVSCHRWFAAMINNINWDTIVSEFESSSSSYERFKLVYVVFLPCTSSLDVSSHLHRDWSTGVLYSCWGIMWREICGCWLMSLPPWDLCKTSCTVGIFFFFFFLLSFAWVGSFGCTFFFFFLSFAWFHVAGRRGALGTQQRPFLGWEQRVRIAIDAAKGLEYLHEMVQPPVVHRNIKSSNILIFDDCRAKIADFDLLNQAPDMATRLLSTRVLGTFGYHAPE